MLEVIRHEGSKWVLYTADGSKVLGKFDTKGEAETRERQIQFFKHQGARRTSPAGLALLVEKHHSAAWHRCWENVKKRYNSRSAAAICTWSVKRPPNPPDVYASLRLAEAVVVLTIDDAAAIDEVLAAEMDLRDIEALSIDTETWEIQEILGEEQVVNPAEVMTDLVYNEQQETCRDWLMARGLLEVGRRHTRREYEIIEEMIRLLAELHGEIDDLEVILQKAETTEASRPIEEAANVGDYLESEIHRWFTMAADNFFGNGLLTRAERIGLSGLIGDALGVFSEKLDAEFPDLRTRDLHWDMGTPTTTEPVTESDGRRQLTELMEQGLARPALNDAGNLSGIVIVEGRSANGNVYTREALQTAPAVFAGKPIYADHPTVSEAQERPERSIRDLVGRLSPNPADFYLAEVDEGPHAGKMALHYQNGRLSSTAGWLETMIREGIAGDQSISAWGAGHEDASGDFVVEAFEDAQSLDFVTTAAAGGRGLLESGATPPQHNTEESGPLESLTFERLVEARPDIVDAIAQRERAKAYGEKAQLTRLKQEVTVMSEKLNQALEGYRRAVKGRRKVQADKILGEELALLPEAVRPHVRRLVEAETRRFTEQIETPTFDLPADVQELPEEAQVTWTTVYMEKLATGSEPEAAAHEAWSVIYSKWVKSEDGTWTKKAEEPLPPEEAPAAASEPFTMEAYRASVKEAVAGFRKALAEAVGDGVTGVGTAPGGPQRSEEQIRESRIAAYKAAGFTDKEAALAVDG